MTRPTKNAQAYYKEQFKLCKEFADIRDRYVYLMRREFLEIWDFGGLVEDAVWDDFLITLGIHDLPEQGSSESYQYLLTTFAEKYEQAMIYISAWKL